MQSSHDQTITLNNNVDQIVDIYLEFVECVVHQVLYVRGLYPKGKFPLIPLEGFPVTYHYSIQFYNSF